MYVAFENICLKMYLTFVCVVFFCSLETIYQYSLLLCLDFWCRFANRVIFFFFLILFHSLIPNIIFVTNNNFNRIFFSLLYFYLIGCINRLSMSNWEARNDVPEYTFTHTWNRNSIWLQMLYVTFYHEKKTNNNKKRVGETQFSSTSSQHNLIIIINSVPVKTTTDRRISLVCERFL